MVGGNPFSRRRRRPPISRYVKYTRDALRGQYIECGEYTYGMPRVLQHAGRKLKIGKFCSIAEGVTIHLGGNHRTDLVTTYPFRGFVDDWPDAVCLQGRAIGAVSKGDVVTKDVEPYSIVGGNPARLIGKRFDEDVIRRLLEIRWWDWPKEKIGRNLGIICSEDISQMLSL